MNPTFLNRPNPQPPRNHKEKIEKEARDGEGQSQAFYHIQSSKQHLCQGDGRYLQAWKWWKLREAPIETGWTVWKEIEMDVNWLDVFLR